MKLYYSPNSCAIEIGALLGEAGAAFEPVKVDTRGGEQHGAAYRAVNAKGKVPTLVRDDGSVLTEWPAIALWIARTYPAAGLWPDAPEAEARALEVTSYVTGTLHGQAFRRMFFPHEFCKDEAHRDAVRADGRARVEAGFAVLAAALGERPFVAGERFGVADAAIFYPTRWAKMYEVALPPAIAALSARVAARPAVADALARLV